MSENNEDRALSEQMDEIRRHLIVLRDAIIYDFFHIEQIADWLVKLMDRIKTR